MKTIIIGSTLLLLTCGFASAAEITVFCPGAVQSIVVPLAKKYAHENGDTVSFKYGTAGAIAQQVSAGAKGDVVIATLAQLRKLSLTGKVIDASIRNLGAMGVGVAVRKGAPKPDIHNVAAFKATMLSAHSIMFANPAKGGQSGIHIAKVFKQLGIYKKLASKLQLRDRSPDGLKEVAAGKIEIGLGQLSEILANKNVTLVGPLPGKLQDLLMFSASLGGGTKNQKAAQGLVSVLTSSAAKVQFRKAGFIVK